MIEYIYGLSGTGKTLYALQKAYLSKKPTAYISLELRIGDAVKMMETWFPDHTFSIHDARHLTLDNLFEYIEFLSKSVDNIVVDGIGMLSSIDRPIGPDLNKLVGKIHRSKWAKLLNIYITEHCYQRLGITTGRGAEEAFDEYTTPSKCHLDNNLILDPNVNIWRSEKKGFVHSVGQVRFTVDENYKITEWFDKDVDDAMEKRKVMISKLHMCGLTDADEQWKTIMDGFDVVMGTNPD